MTTSSSQKEDNSKVLDKEPPIVEGFGIYPSKHPYLNEERKQYPEEKQNPNVAQPPPTLIAQQDHNEKMKKIEAGWLGKALGSGNSLREYMAFVLFLVIFVYYAYVNHHLENSNHFKDISSQLSTYITLIFGFLFGSAIKK